MKRINAVKNPQPKQIDVVVEDTVTKAPSRFVFLLEQPNDVLGFDRFFQFVTGKNFRKGSVREYDTDELIGREFDLDGLVLPGQRGIFSLTLREVKQLRNE